MADGTRLANTVTATTSSAAAGGDHAPEECQTGDEAGDTVGSRGRVVNGAPLYWLLCSNGLG